MEYSIFCLFVVHIPCLAATSSTNRLALVVFPTHSYWPLLSRASGILPSNIYIFFSFFHSSAILSFDNINNYSDDSLACHSLLFHLRLPCLLVLLLCVPFLTDKDLLLCFVASKSQLQCPSSSLTTPQMIKSLFSFQPHTPWAIVFLFIYNKQLDCEN